MLTDKTIRQLAVLVGTVRPLVQGGIQGQKARYFAIRRYDLAFTLLGYNDVLHFDYNLSLRRVPQLIDIHLLSLESRIIYQDTNSVGRILRHSYPAAALHIKCTCRRDE